MYEWKNTSEWKRTKRLLGDFSVNKEEKKTNGWYINDTLSALPKQYRKEQVHYHNNNSNNKINEKPYEIKLNGNLFASRILLGLGVSWLLVKTFCRQNTTRSHSTAPSTRSSINFPRINTVTVWLTDLKSFSLFGFKFFLLLFFPLPLPAHTVW